MTASNRPATLSICAVSADAKTSAVAPWVNWVPAVRVEALTWVAGFELLTDLVRAQTATGSRRTRSIDSSTRLAIG